MPFDNLGAVQLLQMLATLLRQNAEVIQASPLNRTPDEVRNSLRALLGIAERADYLATEISGRR
jgi:hypothetical protein